ncbi:MAG: DUF4411 family protein [Candidatus Cloacimonetes bacterium]|nr:DUF4411 family protein [Candidatus Cloacimonadota bacterium]MBL7086172.1 DUF4411 family protein [Candidatus Cloacimonadota bacterium]
MGEHIYIIDTSSLIGIKPENFPPDIYVGMWSDIENIVKNGRLISHRYVLEELRKYEGKEDEILKWAEKHKNIFKDVTPQQTKLVQQILKKFPSLVDVNGSVEADPFIIAFALEKEPQQTFLPSQKIVVTEEKLKGNKIKIPFVAKDFGVTCINIFDMFRKEGWRW